MSESTQQANTPPARRLRMVARFVFNALIWLSVLVGLLWSVGAIYFLPFGPNWKTVLLAAAYLASLLALGSRISGFSKLRAVIAVSVVAVYALTLQIWPTNDRLWDSDHAQVAEIEIKNGVVEIENFRNNIYRNESDYDARFSTKRFELARLQSVWFVVQKFSDFDGMAHVFLSFGVAPDDTTKSIPAEYFSLSVEIRREAGETYDPIRGLYRCYEITHVIGDERDLIGVRTVHRPNDRVYLYRFNSTPQQAQELFIRFAKRIAKLNERPEFYHSLLNNCANGITRQAYQLTPEPINWLDSRVVLPGYSGELAFEKGLIGDQTEEQDFSAFESDSRIDRKARKAGITDSFSNDIRQPDR